ncbi:nucleotide disphospho-sugar-binding domain-containing protein [Salinifilum ghardaiensis]
MRVLMSAVLQPSHFYPLVPLAWALRGAGHDVRIAHQPCLSQAVRESGLNSVVVGSDMQIDPDKRARAAEERRRQATSTRPTAEEQMRHTRTTLGIFADAAERMVEDTLTFARSWQPDLIVYDWVSYSAHLVASLLDIPAVRHQFPGPDYAVGIPGWRDTERELLAGLYGHYGLSNVEPDGLFTIDPCPPSLQFALPAGNRHQPTRYVPYNGAGQVEPWMARQDPDRPRILLTLGGTYLWMMGDLDPLRAFTETLDGLDVELVIAVPERGTAILGSSGPSLRVVENVPLELILPTCEAVISHGGTGTFATALAHGVPQIISPPSSMGEPPFHSAECITRVGAGLQVDVHADDPRSLREAVRSVIEDSQYRARAERLAAEVRELPRPSDLVADLERSAAHSTEPVTIGPRQ